MSKNNNSSSSSSSSSSNNKNISKNSPNHSQFYNTTSTQNINSFLPVESISSSQDTIFENVDKNDLKLPPTPYLGPKTPTIEPPKLTLTKGVTSSSNSSASTDAVSIFNPMSDLNINDLDGSPSPSPLSIGSAAIASNSKNGGPATPHL